MFQKDMDENQKKLKRKIKGKKVLVIGGAGSIGSAFIKTLLPFEPGSLVVVDLSENSLAELVRDIRSTNGLFVPDDFRTYPFDYASPVFEKMIRKQEGFDIVANFSAHKHVRTEKDIYSIEALLLNNLIYAQKLLELLAENPPESFFCVSTDKASNPANIMGASKRIMEDLIFSYSDRFPVKTARFANVAFSNGSLPSGLLSRISKLQPISAPKDTRRFFVSMEEAGQICLLACVLGENRCIFFPKLDESQMMTFDLIATTLLEEHGYKVLQCTSDDEALERAKDLKKGSNLYPVHFSLSDTSGEKLYEEFSMADESVDLECFHALGKITGKGIPDKNRLSKLFFDLNSAFETETTKEKIVAILRGYLPCFEHIETGKSLDSKM